MKKYLIATVAMLAIGAQASGEKITTQQAQAEMEKQIGFVPNVLKEMSKSPAVPLIYTRSDKLLHDNAHLSLRDQQVVQLVVSLYNGCDYCSSMHSKFSEINGVSHEDVVRIRHNEYPKKKRLGDLMWTTRLILDKKGHLDSKEQEIIANMGITRP